MTPPRPRGLAETALLMCLTNAMGWFIIDWSQKRAHEEFVMNTAFIAIGYVVLWFYWEGRNWARILVLITSVLAILNVLFFRRAASVARVMIVVEALLAVFLLYWLNRGDVKAFFRATKTP